MFKWTLTNNITGEIYVLQKDPLGWEELQLVHNRSEKYDGIFFDFSLNLSFGCKGSGKEFVDAAYDSLGSEADVSLLLQYYCDSPPLVTLFRGKLNYSSYKEKYISRQLYSVLDIEKEGITQQVINRDSTDVDLFSPTSIGGTVLTPYSDLVLQMHSRSIYMKSNWVGSEHGCCTNIQDDVWQVHIVPTLVLEKSDFDKSSPTTSVCRVEQDNTVEYFQGAPAIIEVPTGGSIFTQTNNTTINWAFTGTMALRQQDFVAIGDCDTPDCSDDNVNDPPNINQVINYRLRLYFGNDTAGSASESCEGAIASGALKYIDLLSLDAHIWASVTPTELLPFTGSDTINVPLQEGDKVWLYWQVGFNGTFGLNYKISFTYDVATLSIESNTVSEETTCKALAIHEAWSRICEGITDKILAFRSEFFGRTNSQGLSYPADGVGSRTAITDGYRIRGFEQVLVDADVSAGETKKGILTNLSDAFESCNAVWGIGLGVENYNGIEVVRVEEKTYFFSDNRLLRLSEVPGIEMEFLSKNAYSSVDIGYEKWKPNYKNGLDETNSKSTWEFPAIKSIKNKLTLLSKYVAAQYTIETTRRKNVIFQTSDDTPYDDDIFFIALSNEDLTVPEKDENITVISGLLDSSSAYNLRFNLFSNFDRLMNQFTVNLTKNQPQSINYSYFEGNASMKFQYNVTGAIAGELNGEVVENIQNTTYPNSRHRRGNPIMLPEQYKFSYPVAFSDYLNILNNPYGFIEFSEGTSNYKRGYIKTLTYHLKKKIAEFVLIRKYE